MRIILLTLTAACIPIHDKSFSVPPEILDGWTEQPCQTDGSLAWSPADPALNHPMSAQAYLSQDETWMSPRVITFNVSANQYDIIPDDASTIVECRFFLWVS